MAVAAGKACEFRIGNHCLRNRDADCRFPGRRAIYQPHIFAGNAGRIGLVSVRLEDSEEHLVSAGISRTDDSIAGPYL